MKEAGRKVSRRDMEITHKLNTAEWKRKLLKVVADEYEKVALIP